MKQKFPGTELEYNGITIKSLDGVLNGWDGCLIRHGTSMVGSCVGNIYGSFAAKIWIIKNGMPHLPRAECYTVLFTKLSLILLVRCNQPLLTHRIWWPLQRIGSNKDIRLQFWTLKNKAQANNKFWRNKNKLLSIEGSRSQQKGLMPWRFTTASNNKGKVVFSIPSMLLCRGMQQLATQGGNSFPYPSSYMYQARAQSYQEYLFCHQFGWQQMDNKFSSASLLYSWCTWQHRTLPTPSCLFKIRVAVALHNKELKIIFKIDNSFHLRVKNTVATQLICLGRSRNDLMY